MAVDWDFKLAREFSKAFRTEPSIDDISATLQSSSRTSPKGLGDFTRVYSFLGSTAVTLPLNIKPNTRHEPVDSASSEPSSYSTAASSPPSDNFDDFINSAKAKSVRWKDETIRNNLAHGRRWSAKASDIDSIAIVQLLEESESAPEARHISASSIDLSRSELLPSSITPSRSIYITPIPVSHADPTIIRPFYHLTANEQKAKLIRKIKKRYPDPTSLLETDTALAIQYVGGVTDPKNGIHIFVDFSNIMIGFCNRLKASRNIHRKAYAKNALLSYHSLALLLERGRPVARRVLVGSTARGNPYDTNAQKLPDHFTEAMNCGYECNILERVCKPQALGFVRKNRNGTGNGYLTGTSGPESGSESAFPESKRPVMAEQAVDELLQMKLLESLVDTAKPSTIVLASGDAAEAEFSGGFFKNVQRALAKGWKVEIVAWNGGLSNDYRNREFLQNWKGRIKVIELDEFCEELLAIYVTPR